MIRCKTTMVLGVKGGKKMSDTRLDIERDKYLEWKEQQYWAMRSACEDCDSHTTLGCPYYDKEQETFDFEECFRDSGWIG